MLYKNFLRTTVFRRTTIIPVLILGFALFGILSYAGDLPEPEWVSDTELTARVEAELAQDPDVYAAKISVRAHDGVVSLIGNVPTYKVWQRAQEQVRQIPGIVRLNTSDLVIRSRPLSRHSDDSQIAAEVEQKLAVQAGIDPASFEVVSEDGTITLIGQVRSAKLKRTAGLLAYSTAKVRTVNNLLEVS